MADKQHDRKVFAHLFGVNGKAEDEPPVEPVPDQEEVVGPCAAIAKNKWITALTIQHTGKAWESFQYKDLSVRSEFEPTRFAVGFADAHDRYVVIVTGRCLDRIYGLVIQGRMEWLRAADRDFGKDGEPIVLKIEVVPVPEKRP